MVYRIAWPKIAAIGLFLIACLITQSRRFVVLHVMIVSRNFDMSSRFFISHPYEVRRTIELDFRCSLFSMEVEWNRVYFLQNCQEIPNTFLYENDNLVVFRI
jgi:hypothetical protein